MSRRNRCPLPRHFEDRRHNAQLRKCRQCISNSRNRLLGSTFFHLHSPSRKSRRNQCRIRDCRVVHPCTMVNTLNPNKVHRHNPHQTRNAGSLHILSDNHHRNRCLLPVHYEYRPYMTKPGRLDHNGSTNSRRFCCTINHWHTVSIANLRNRRSIRHRFATHLCMKPQYIVPVRMLRRPCIADRSITPRTRPVCRKIHQHKVAPRE